MSSLPLSSNFGIMLCSYCVFRTVNNVFNTYNFHKSTRIVLRSQSPSFLLSYSSSLVFLRFIISFKYQPSSSSLSTCFNLALPPWGQEGLLFSSTRYWTPLKHTGNSVFSQHGHLSYQYTCTDPTTGAGLAFLRLLAVVHPCLFRRPQQPKTTSLKDKHGDLNKSACNRNGQYLTPVNRKNTNTW